jgi:hypothetical protein
VTSNLERRSIAQQARNNSLEPLLLPATPDDVLGGGARQQIDFLAAHLFHQIKAHESAQKRTAVMFEQLLRQLEEVVVTFRQSFLNRHLANGQVYACIDADRSIGILNLLWHTVSFTMRNNIKPMAMPRKGRDPMFSGRIVAFLGDYHETVTAFQSQEYRDLMEDELASLFVPASPEQPAVMRFRHSRTELFFHQAEAPQQFLLTLLEALCSGGYYHETSHNADSLQHGGGPGSSG